MRTALCYPCSADHVTVLVPMVFLFSRRLLLLLTALWHGFESVPRSSTSEIPRSTVLQTPRTISVSSPLMVPCLRLAAYTYFVALRYAPSLLSSMHVGLTQAKSDDGNVAPGISASPALDAETTGVEGYKEGMIGRP